MKPIVCLSFLLFVCLSGGSVAWSADLESDIRTILRDKTLARAEVGVQIVRLGATAGKDTVVFRHNSDIPLIPASNLKLVTTSAALAWLTPGFKFRTVLLKHNNDLVLIGDGDPTLGDWELLKKTAWNTTTLYDNWGKALAGHGLKFERVIVDDSIFDEQFLHPNWPADQALRHYVAQVGGVNFNINVLNFSLRATGAGQNVDYTLNPSTRYAHVTNACVSAGDSSVGFARPTGTNNIVLRGRSPSTGEAPLTVTIHDPALYAGTVLAERLQNAGVKIAAPKPVRDRTLREALIKTPIDKDPSWTLLAIHETPLAAVLARANKDSINLYAEVLAKRIGAAATGKSGSWKNGCGAVGDHLTKIGIPTEQFHLDDGSGLSKENTVSANAFCHVLAWNFHAPTREAYLNSLAISGKDGTLEHRFQGAMSDLRGRVFGKSGYVNQVRTLSGYLKAKDDQWYAFSILINRLSDTPAGKNLQELIVRAIDSHSRDLAAGN